MANRLPLWHGQPRGAGLASLSVLDASQDDAEDQSFFRQLGDRLFGWITDDDGLVTGIALPLIALLIATVVSAREAPLAAAFLALTAVLWLVATGWSWWLVASKGDDAPSWATQVVRGLAGFGRAAITAAICLTIAAVVAAVLAVIIAASSDRR